MVQSPSNSYLGVGYNKPTHGGNESISVCFVNLLLKDYITDMQFRQCNGKCMPLPYMPSGNSSIPRNIPRNIPRKEE
jgi:hypothetical protein